MVPSQHTSFKVYIIDNEMDCTLVKVDRGIPECDELLLLNLSTATTCCRQTLITMAVTMARARGRAREQEPSATCTRYLLQHNKHHTQRYLPSSSSASIRIVTSLGCSQTPTLTSATASSLRSIVPPPSASEAKTLELASVVGPSQGRENS